ncbi:MAG: ferrous iron transport protein B [Rhodocyclaceae bacterium]|nr:ferrous iron transport protein B [Rhodocyclaceae bacterium]
MNAHYRIALAGNPNCGKTTLFNALTGARRHVGNWPGVTVEKKSGEYRHDGKTIEVIDLPGTYSLDVHQVSLDERVAHDFIAGGTADLIVNIVDAANLERNLYLTTQLAAMRAPMLVVLNMIDVAEAKGQPVDAQALAARLGCPVVPVVAAKGTGVDALKTALNEAAARKTLPTLAQLDDAHGDDVAAATTRYGLASQLAGASVQAAGVNVHPLTERIDNVALNRWLGVPIYLLLMYLMFMFTIQIGGAFIDFFDQFAGAIFVDGFAVLLGGIGAPEWLTVLLAKGIGGGIQTVATFIPIIGFLYLLLSVLEDSGYMARAAFVMDRLMRIIGLPGKSFVPLIVGFGCNVPAIMATRTLEKRRDRLMTIAMAPFMSCGARLPVYVLFAAAFFPNNAQNVVFALYLIGIFAAIGTGLLLKHSLLKGKPTPYVMELPPYHVPTLKGILIHSWSRLKGFIVGAGRIIVPMVLVINFLNAIGTDGSFGNEDSDKSMLAEVGRTITPAFRPFGLTEENWPAAVGIFTGILAKEAVVGTLDAAYTALAGSDAAAAGAEPKEEEPFSLGRALSAAVATIPANLGDALGSWADPLGIAVGDLSDQEAVAEEQAVHTGTFGAMAARFDGAAGAFAYLLFILLYFPCTAAIAAVYQESGTRWTLFVAGWTTGLAYGLATLWYQVANFGRDPLIASIWIGIVGAMFATAFIAMRRYGEQSSAIGLMPVPAASCAGCKSGCGER